jgi:hypothetical protein
MFVAIEVKTPEARNFLVNGLRSLMSSKQLDCSRPLSTFNECKSQERFSEDDQVDYKKKYEQLVSQVNLSQFYFFQLCYRVFCAVGIGCH